MSSESEENFTLKIKNLTGSVYNVTAKGSNTVLELKQMIAQQADCDVFALKIMKGRKFLKPDDETLANFDITKAMLLKVVIRMSMVTPEVETLDCSGDSSERARSVSLSPNDRYCASGTYYGGLHIYNTVTGEKIAYEPPENSSCAIRRVQFNKNADRILTGHADNQARYWAFNGRELTFIRSFQLIDDRERAEIWTAPFSYCYTYCVLGAESHSIAKCFNVETGELVTRYDHPSGAVKASAWSSDSSWIATSTNEIHIWERDTGSSLFSKMAHSARLIINNVGLGSIWNLAVTKDDQHVLAIGPGTGIKMFSTDNGDLVKYWQVGINAYDFKLIKNDQFIAFCQSGKFSLIRVENDDKEPPIQVCDCKSNPEQVANSHYKHAFLLTTGGGSPAFFKIPEEKFFGAM